MPKNEVAELFSLVPQIATTILKATGAVAFSIAQNNGKEAKQIIPHVHVHIIPRYADTRQQCGQREEFLQTTNYLNYNKKLKILSNYDVVCIEVWLRYFLNCQASHHVLFYLKQLQL